MSPKRVIHANDKTVEKYLNEGVQLLRLMEKLNYTTVCADVMVLLFLTIHFVIASLGSLVLTGKPMHLSSSLPRRQNMLSRQDASTADRPNKDGPCC